MVVREIAQKDLCQVKKLLADVMQINRCTQIERMGGLTNRTYKVQGEDGRLYVVRIPGEGTEELIIRKNEKVSTELACRLGIDAQLLYFGDDGAKITQYIPGAVTMSSETMKEKEHIKQAAEIFKKLHNSNVNTGVPFEVFDMAAGYEKIINDKNVAMFEDYVEMKNIVMKIQKEIDSFCEIKKVSCHNDPLCENWITDSEGRMYLIDWEYAGMNDGMWDLADVSIEAAYNHQMDEILLKEYLGRELNYVDWRHFMANKIFVDYLWTLWAKTRVPYDGQPMEDWAIERYERLKNNVNEFNKIGEN